MTNSTIRFPDFNDFFVEKKLGEISDIKTGNKDTQNKIIDGAYPFFVRSNNVERINSYSYDGEAILTSGDGVGVGKNFHYIDGKFDFHQRVYCIRNFKKGYDGLFIFFIFKEQFNQRVRRLSAKNSVDSVRMDMIADMKLLFPSLNEQKKIAGFLQNVENRLNLLKEKKTLFEQYKKAVMQKIFSQELRFKDEKGEDFPEWSQKKIQDILTIGSGKDYKHLGSGEIPVYGTGGLMTHVNNYIYDGESVCIGRKGTINKPMFLNGKFWTVDTLFYTHSFVNVLPKFIYYQFLTVNWIKHNEAGGVPSLSKSTIEQITLQVPSPKEQEKISTFLTQIDKRIEIISSQISGTEEWKKSLLQQMFV